MLRLVEELRHRPVSTWNRGRTLFRRHESEPSLVGSHDDCWVHLMSSCVPPPQPHRTSPCVGTTAWIREQRTGNGEPVFAGSSRGGFLEAVARLCVGVRLRDVWRLQHPVLEGHDSQQPHRLLGYVSDSAPAQAECPPRQDYQSVFPEQQLQPRQELQTGAL